MMPRPVVVRMAILGYESSELTKWRFTPHLVASDTSVEAPLEPVKLFESIRRGMPRHRPPICCPSPQVG
jgi:hypothetical protein